MLPRHGAGPTFLSAAASERWSQLSQVWKPVNRANFAQSLDINMLPGSHLARNDTWSLVVAWSMDIDTEHCLLHGPQWQHMLGYHHVLRWQSRLLISGYSTPPSCLQVYLFSKCSNYSLSLSFPFQHDIHVHHSCPLCGQAMLY